MNFTKLIKEEQLTILANVAEDKGIVDNAVEKDYWVSMVLRAIFSLPYATAFVFKGGTSLSKGWGCLIVKSSRHGVDWIIQPIFRTQYRSYLLKVSKRFCVTTISRCKSASSMPMHLLSMRLWND